MQFGRTPPQRTFQKARTAREMRERGGLTWVRQAVPTNDLKAVFGA